MLTASEVDDASRLNRTRVSDVVHVRTEGDVRAALDHARERGLRVSIAGSRHSMGGQTLGPGHLVLDMTGLRGLDLDADTGILTAEAGAVWRDVQRYLDARGRSVWVMQSDNVFTVGGTISVNAHGWQPRRPPMGSTVASLRLMLASGEIVTCSRQENGDLFAGVIGGYGLLGVILDVRLRTVPNVVYRKQSWFAPVRELPALIDRHVSRDPSVGLAYARLSVDGAHLLTEAGLHVYRPAKGARGAIPAMTDEGMVALKREVLRDSERSDAGKRRRWLVEKQVGPLLERGEVTRNTAMNPDIHVLWPTDPARRDILHEYFVPHDRLLAFLDGLRAAVRRSGPNLLNVTIRDVRRDEDSLLAYAPADRLALVLLFSQEATPAAEDAMQALTVELVEAALGLGGSFYLPYRLHYTREQFERAYPRAGELFALKARVDPEGRFSSRFFDHVRNGR